MISAKRLIRKIQRKNKVQEVQIDVPLEYEPEFSTKSRAQKLGLGKKSRKNNSNKSNKKLPGAFAFGSSTPRMVVNDDGFSNLPLAFAVDSMVQVNGQSQQAPFGSKAPRMALHSEQHTGGPSREHVVEDYGSLAISGQQIERPRAQYGPGRTMGRGNVNATPARRAIEIDHVKSQPTRKPMPKLPMYTLPGMIEDDWECYNVEKNAWE